MKQVTAAVIGLGARGAEVYAKYSLIKPDRLKIVAIADIEESKVKKYQEVFKVSEDLCFTSGEELLEKEQLADVLFVCSPDRDHYHQTIIGLQKGYDILLEKPISPDEKECLEISKLAKKLNRKVAVCHVLRYAPMYSKIKELLDDNVIGDIVSLNQIENVGYWHQAHSFVRGNWRNSIESAPMILAKTCHDFDQISWFLHKRCLSVSSFGNLKYFKSKNAPKGSKKRCTDGCKVENCPYDARKIYLENFKKYPKDSRDVWPFVVLDNHPTEESLTKALKEGPYGRCVFHCDNDVVDHQTVNMIYEDGVTANLTMTAFSGVTYRKINVMGTLGEIIADDHTQVITIRKFDGTFTVNDEKIDIKEMYKDLKGHGGGDDRLVEDFLNVICGEESVNYRTSIENSTHSHIIAFAAEKSRINNGQVIQIDKGE